MSSNKDFMKAQIEEIQKDKWIESEKAGYDLKEEAVRNWIRNHAKEFREKWEAENGKVE